MVGLFFCRDATTSIGQAEPCLYKYTLIMRRAGGSLAGGSGRLDGTSGIIIDNISMSHTGAQQVYFNTLTCNSSLQTSQWAL